MNKIMIAVYIALLICPFIALIATFFVAIFEYRKNNIINVVRCTDFYLMICFFFGAYFVTMLPFPSLEIVAGLTTPYTQLIPFYWIYDFIANSGLVISDWKTVIPSMGSGIMIGVICNIIMLFPTGYFMQRLYKLNRKKTILIGFLMSLLFEITQLTGLFSFYSRPYRIFDVDDLIQNTFGMVLGAELARVLNIYFINDNVKVRQGGEVSFRRRMKVDVIDQAVLNAIILCGVFFTKTNITYFRIHPFKSFPIYFAFIMFMNFCLAVVTYITNGKTLGMYFIGLRLRSFNGERLKLLQCISRDLIYGFYVNLPILIGWFILLSRDRHISISIICTLLSAVSILLYVHFNLSMVLHIITHGEKLVYERISRTHLGLDEDVVVRQRQKVLYRNRLLPENIEQASATIRGILLYNGAGEKQGENLQFLVESALVQWMDKGLFGHNFTVQIDNRFEKKTLLICVPGKNVPLMKEDDEVYSIILEKRISFDTRVSFDDYYTGGINVFAIELE